MAFSSAYFYRIIALLGCLLDCLSSFSIVCVIVVNSYKYKFLYVRIAYVVYRSHGIVAYDNAIHCY